MNLSDLRKLRCPHNWGFNCFKDLEEHLLRKKSDCLDDEVDASDKKYASQVAGYQLFCLISYEKYRNEKYSEALEYIDKTNVTDDFMDKYERVFKHVTEASRAHILYKLNCIEEANQIIHKLKDESFNRIEEAGFKYLESRLRIRYNEEGSDICVKLIESAIETVNDEAEFYFSLGTILGRIRHFNFPAPPPSDKEFEACRKAVSLQKNLPCYSVTLARIYMDIRFSLPKPKRDIYSQYAASVYSNLLKHHESLTGNDIARCVYNLMKVKFDPDLEEYADLALKKCDTILVNHYIGMFYIRNHQFSEALDCLNKVSNDLPFVCGMVLLLMYRLNGNALSDDEIDSLVKPWTVNYKSSSDKKLIDFHLSISQFYLLVKNDHTNASIQFLLAYDYDILEASFINLTKHNNTSNYLAVLRNEIMLKSLKNEQMVEALVAFGKLPRNAVTQKNPRWPVPSLFELKRDLV